MKATLVTDERHKLEGNAFAEIRVWRVPKPVPGSMHDLKYSLALVVNDECVLRYDNEAGKGDHRHYGNVEEPYGFVDAAKLIADFWKDVDQWNEATTL